ncbi:holin [Domibacillus indicus]|uniref:holin n=1 Tax=Domibacillus indicus TaxID=1437523 RepID=UPI00203A6B74|nr:holin [Domibacillus indicus]MCM3790713.1 holin [Domibacillus indicus]
MTNRFKNYGLWVAVAALGGMVLQDAGIVTAPEKYDAYVNIGLTILIAAGIINNPSNGSGYKDEEK